MVAVLIQPVHVNTFVVGVHLFQLTELMYE